MPNACRILQLPRVCPTLEWVLSAFGWAPGDNLKGVVRAYLRSQHDFQRYAGMVACSLHRVDPGDWPEWLTDRDELVRRRALRLVGELGRTALLDACVDEATREGPTRFWAARSAVLLGDRGLALNALTDLARANNGHHVAALQFAIQGMASSSAHRLLTRLAEDGIDSRTLTIGSGIAGDPAYVPWLLRQMGEPHRKSRMHSAWLRSGFCRIETDWMPDSFSLAFHDPDDPNVDKDLDDGCLGRIRKIDGGGERGRPRPAPATMGTGEARALKTCEERLPAPADPGGSLPLSPWARHAARQYQRAGVAATAAARKDVVGRGREIHTGCARSRVSDGRRAPALARRRHPASADQNLAARQRYLLCGERVALLAG